MKRSTTNTVELSLQDIFDKFKLGKGATNIKATVDSRGLPNNSDNGSGTELESDAKIVFTFETVKAEKAKKTGGRPRKTKPATDAANGASTAPASA